MITVSSSRLYVWPHLSTRFYGTIYREIETQFGGIYFRERIRAMYTVIRESDHDRSLSIRPEVSTVPDWLDLHRITVESLDSLTPTSNKPPRRDRRLPKDSFTHLTAHPALPETVKPLLKVFLKQLEAARYARSEPNEKEFENCMKVVALMLGM
jgi:hypothetical protein